MPHLTLSARYVFPVTGPPIPDGSVTIDGQRVVAVGPCGADVLPAFSRAGETPAPQEVRDLGNAAILPGLVNAHVHLEFSNLVKPLGEPGIGFVDWIRRAMDYRRAIATQESDTNNQNNSRELTAPGGQTLTAPGGRRVALGLHESLRCGVTTLGEIAQPGWPIEMVASSPLNLTVFQELIAPTAQRVAGALELARLHLRNSRGLTAPGMCWRPGLSPHAPYSVHPELLAAVIALSAAERVPVAMHLAESREELELLQHGTGPLRVLLEELGAWDATAIRTERRPMEYLRLLAAAHRALVIHGNCLDDEEIAFLGMNAARMTAVYCPRTHDWFARGAYPLEKMLAAGVRVALGTDGRGSSPDLSLLAEMRCAARRHPAVGLDRILQMGTIAGATALGWEDRVGSLEPGKQADLAIVALPDRDAADPHELLFDSAEPVVACYCRGREISPVGYASA